MARKSVSKKLAPVATVVTEGSFAQHVSDHTDHLRYEARAAELTETFGEETVGEMVRRITDADSNPFELLDPTPLSGEPQLSLETQADELDAALATLEMSALEDTEAQVLSAEADLLQEQAEEVHEEPAVSDEPDTTEEPKTFAEAMRAFDDAAVQSMTLSITASIDARESFELAKKGAGHNIQKTLNKVRKQLMWKDTSRVMLAANVDPSFINRTLHDGSRYNVYAIDKVADAVKALADGVVSNAINRACMISLFQMRKAGLPFTGEVAKACASDKHHIDLAIRKHLVRHTVSAGTAPTQASSTMQALETLGIVKREGSSRNPTFTLTDSPIVQRLEDVLFARAA